jgi:predicted nucleic acid-binding protein
VADAGPLIALAGGGVLPSSLAMLGGLLVPEAVLHECCADPHAPGATEITAARASGIKLLAHSAVADLDAALTQGLGSGEIAVLAYARQHGLLSLIDERRARRVAARLRVSVIGSGAVLAALKRQGHIESVKPVLSRWQQHGYFVGQSVELDVLRLAGEG